jgi:hypothetical protein
MNRSTFLKFRDGDVPELRAESIAESLYESSEISVADTDIGLVVPVRASNELRVLNSFKVSHDEASKSQLSAERVIFALAFEFRW